MTRWQDRAIGFTPALCDLLGHFGRLTSPLEHQSCSRGGKGGARCLCVWKQHVKCVPESWGTVSAASSVDARSSRGAAAVSQRLLQNPHRGARSELRSRTLDTEKLLRVPKSCWSCGSSLLLFMMLESTLRSLQLFIYFKWLKHFPLRLNNTLCENHRFHPPPLKDGCRE